ncbi:MAG: hypothetical protein WC676_05290 [Candidatus Omnitrophota bacterium]
MVKAQFTNRQKNISRVIKEKRSLQNDKNKTRGGFRLNREK